MKNRVLLLKPRVLLLFTLLCAAMASVQSGTAVTITVNSTADPSESGKTTLRDALAAANDGDTINFSVTTPATITLTSGQLVVGVSVIINGPGADQLAVDANHNSRVFVINSGETVTISGLTITNGSGGGIGNFGATLTVNNSTISGNSAEGGGGIYNAGDSAHDATLTVNNSTISGNSASGPVSAFGGGIINIAGCDHFGFCGTTATLTVNNSTISGNSADEGGGIYNASGTITVSNSTISGNSIPLAPGMFAGGIYNTTLPGPFRGTITVSNSTLSSSSRYAIANYGATVTIGSTILNTGGLGNSIVNVLSSGTVTSDGYNLSRDDGGGVLTAIGDQILIDPMLGPLANNGGPTFTHALLPGSPAIDQGKNFSGSTTDQRGTGFARTFDNPAIANATGGDGTDIGAFEVQPSPSPTPTATATSTPAPTPTPSPTPEETHLTVTSVTGTYGGMVTVSATLTSNSSPVSARTITFTLSGNSAGTGVTDGSGVASVTNVSLSGINAGTYSSGVAASFAGDGSYSGSSGAAGLTVLRKFLTVTATGIDKMYDGTTAAYVTLSDDRIAGDVLNSAFAAASFADKDVGTNKPVSVHGISISGSDAGNYNLLNTTANTTANITLRNLLITAQDQSKTYGTPFAFAGTEFTLGAAGLATGDSVNSVTLSSAGAPATAPSATYPITVSAAVGSGLSNYAISYAVGTFSVAKDPTSIVYTGFVAGNYLGTYTASAMVSDSTGLHGQGAVVHFSLSHLPPNGELQGCSGTVDASGFVSCSMQLTQSAGTYGITASFLGNDNYMPSSTASTITVTVDGTSLVYTGSSQIVNNRPLTVSAVFTDTFTGGPISGESISFSLGAGAGVQNCSATTDGHGIASCTIANVSQPAGPGSITTSFSGNPYYLPTSTTTSVLISLPYIAVIQQPINADGSSVFNVRRGVVPVKFTLTQNGQATCQLPSATIAVYRTGTGGNEPVSEAVYSGAADNGSNFRIDSCQYVYNLSASALGVGTYRVDILINAQVVGSANFALR